jgi:tetratricopeptide (TPR) repeat protein
MPNHKFCVSCGSPLNANAKFCTVCGERVAEEPPASVGGDVHIAPPFSPQSPQPPEPASPRKRRRLSRPALIGIIAGAAALLVAAVLALTAFDVLGIFGADKPLTAVELLDLGEKYLLELDYEQAIVYFEQLIDIEPRNPRGYTGLAEAYAGLGDTDKAREALERGLEATDGNRSVQRALNKLEAAPSGATPHPSAAPAEETPVEAPTVSPEPERSTALVSKTPEFYVADYAGVLEQDTKNNIIDSNSHETNGLETLCDGAQIVVVTVEYLDGMYSDEYAMTLFNDWGVGSAEYNNGMLLLLATKENKAWLTVGSGITGVFTDSMVDSYFDRYFWKDYDAGDFDDAVNNMLEPLFTWYADYYGVDSGTATDVFPNMTKAEHKTLHTFFSNFSEVGMGAFDANDYSDDQLISFAIWHTYRNSHNLITPANREYYSGKITSERVSSVVERYFGIRVRHKSIGYIDNPNFWNYGQYTYLYEDGYYYFRDAYGEGEPLRWAQVTRLIDNHNGTYTAYFDEYASHTPPDNLYEDIADWHLQTQDGTMKVIKKGDVASGDGWEAAIYSGSYIALVTPFDYNGNATYQLISLKSTS